MEKIRGKKPIKLVFFHFFRQNIGARDESRGSVEEAGGEKTSGITEIEMNHVKKW